MTHIAYPPTHINWHSDMPISQSCNQIYIVTNFYFSELAVLWNALAGLKLTIDPNLITPLKHGTQTPKNIEHNQERKTNQTRLP